MVIRNPVEKIARYVGSSLGNDAKDGEPRRNLAVDNPLVSVAVGLATTWLARRVLPARIVGLGAALAAGYITTKLTQRMERLAEQREQEALQAPTAPKTRKIAANPAANGAKPVAKAAAPRRRAPAVNTAKAAE